MRKKLLIIHLLAAVLLCTLMLHAANKERRPSTVREQKIEAVDVMRKDFRTLPDVLLF
jgi:hypothetical protein